MDKNEISKVGREKYWKELSAEEKCDRMRTIVKHLQNALGQAQQTIEQLNRHVHSANEIYFREPPGFGVVEAGGPNRRPTDDNEVYF